MYTYRENLLYCHTYTVTIHPNVPPPSFDQGIHTQRHIMTFCGLFSHNYTLLSVSSQVSAKFAMVGKVTSFVNG